MNVVILSSRSGWHTDELCRALAARGAVGRVLSYERLVAGFISSRRSLRAHSIEPPTGARPTDDGVSILDADAVLARIIPDGSLEQIIYRVDALHWIEERGIPVMNSPRAIERSVDKFYTTALLAEAAVPTPDTVVCESADGAMAAIERMIDEGAEVIIKPLFGSMGHGLVRVANVELAWRVVRALLHTRSVFYVQRAIEHSGHDVRAFVVGGEVIAAIARVAPAGDWRTNVAVGGSARPLDLPERWTRLAVRAAEAVGAVYAGVDLIESRGGELFVLEVNAIPGWQGLQRATGVDVAGALVNHLFARVAAVAGSA